MHLEQAIRLLAGTVVLTGTVCAVFVHPGWIALVAFVALNLIQSAFTGFCPAEWVFRQLGLRPRVADR